MPKTHASMHAHLMDGWKGSSDISTSCRSGRAIASKPKPTIETGSYTSTVGFKLYWRKATDLFLFIGSGGTMKRFVSSWRRWWDREGRMKEVMVSAMRLRRRGLEGEVRQRRSRGVALALGCLSSTTDHSGFRNSRRSAQVQYFLAVDAGL
jgi:hypothetical protein